MAETTCSGQEYLQPGIDGVSVIIPCKNEELAIAQTISSVRESLSELDVDYEIIIVDDGSTDRTREIAIESGARVLVHGINLGYGNAIMNGISKAKYDTLTITDADGTYPVSMLPQMIAEASRYDMVIGSRQFNDDNTSCQGMWMRRLLYYIILYFTGVSAPDYNSGLRVFHKHNLMRYRGILCPTFSFTTTLTLIYLLTARTILFLPIEYGIRIGQSKVCYSRDAIRTLSYLFIIINLFKPNRLSLFFLMLSIATNAAAFAIGLILGLQPATQISVHVAICSMFVICMIAMCIYPLISIYHKQVQHEFDIEK